MSIKRMVLEVNLRKRPFKEGETLVSYAKRILKEDDILGTVTAISTSVPMIDVSTMRDVATNGGRFEPGNETVEIEIRTPWMVR